MTTHERRYVVCIRNDGADDLEVRKIYRILDDPQSSKRGLLRVVDESGDDYLYPAAYFVRVELPHEAEQAIAAAG